MPPEEMQYPAFVEHPQGVELNLQVYLAPGTKPARVPTIIKEEDPSLLSALERDLNQFDPFACLPLKLDRSGQTLLAFSKEVLLDHSIPVSWKNPAVSKAVGLNFSYRNEQQLCSVLSATSSYMDLLHRRGVSLETMKWKCAAMRYVNLLISNPMTRYGDDALMGIMSLLLNEILTAGSENCHIHSRGIAQLLKHRPCQEDARSSPSMVYFMCSLFIVTSKGQIAHLKHVTSNMAGIEDTRNWKAEVDFFLHVLRNLHCWTQQLQYSCSPTRNLPQSAFSHFILHGTLEHQDEFQLSYQLFVQCYLALVLYSHRESVDSCVTLFRKFFSQFRQLGRDHGPECCLHNAVWICIQSLDGNVELKWQASRMIRVLHRLSERTRLRLQRFFVGIYAATTGHPPVIISQQDFESINQEALKGLPVSALK